MSALGHKQTYAVQQAMSALPPIATAKADMCKWSCLLYPRKQTCAAQTVMSALDQNRKFQSFRPIALIRHAKCFTSGLRVGPYSPGLSRALVKHRGAANVTRAGDPQLNRCSESALG